MSDQSPLAPPGGDGQRGGTLDELAPGRTYIGIGSGDTGVSHLGLGGSSLAPGGYTVLVSAKAIGEKSALVFTAGTLKFTIDG